MISEKTEAVKFLEESNRECFPLLHNLSTSTSEDTQPDHVSSPQNGN